MLGVQRARSPSESPLDFMQYPGFAWYGKQTGPRLVEIPFQILQRRRYTFVEILRSLPLDLGIQRLAYVETGLRQLHEILAVDHLILLGNRWG